MGHLINPKSMRIGWIFSWEDLWFIKSIYYPEFLHLVLKLRCFLIYFFGLPLFEEVSIFYSHFLIIKKYKSIVCCIFWYMGILEDTVEEFVFDNWQLFFRGFYSTEEKRYIIWDKWHHFIFGIFLLFHFFSCFNFLKWNKSTLDDFFINIFYLDFTQFRKILKKMRVSSKFKNCLIFFFFIYYKLLNFVRLEKGLLSNYVLKQFLVSYFWAFSMGLSFKILCEFLEALLKYLFFYSINLKIFLISNENVCAKFLSRYMARKIGQGYSVRELVNPIKIELYRVIERLNFSQLKNYLFNRRFKLRAFNVNSNFSKGFKRLFYLFSMLYFKSFLNFYLFLNSWITFEMFFLYYFFFKQNLNLRQIIGFSNFFFKHKANFNLFFNWDFIGFSNFFFKLFNFSNFKEFFYFIDLNFLFLQISKEFFTLNSIFFWNFNIQINYQVLYGCCFFFNRFITYNYYKYNYKWLYNYIHKNHLRSRLPNSFSTLNSFGIFGFKFHFKGRFSRKQRAASLWFQVGRMPLNTLSSNIDFAFYTVPLINSAMTVRVWLYKGFLANDFYFKLV